jgi:hypothetical protein
MEENTGVTGGGLDPANVHIIFDENKDIKDAEKLPIHEPLKLFRYSTIKKNNSLGWWSAVVLLEDHGKKLVCFYRWRRRNGEWKREKKITFHSVTEWNAIKSAVELFMADI